jgi:hypothetical protein
MTKPEQISSITILLSQGMFCWFIMTQEADKYTTNYPTTYSLHMAHEGEMDEFVSLLATLIEQTRG